MRGSYPSTSMSRRCKTLSRKEKNSGLTRRDNCSSESPCVSSAARIGVADKFSIASVRKLIVHLDFGTPQRVLHSSSEQLLTAKFAKESQRSRITPKTSLFSPHPLRSKIFFAPFAQSSRPLRLKAFQIENLHSKI